VLQAKEHTLTPFSFVAFTFKLVVESIKKLGGASQREFDFVMKNPKP
jgi:hypothetical protein